MQRAQNSPEPNSDQVTKAAWKDLVAEGVEAQNVIGAQWKLGDLALGAETTYGDHTLAEFAEAIGVDEGTLTSYRTVARAYEIPRRLGSLSWSHHQTAVYQPDRDAWLQKAAGEHWSVAKLREEITLDGVRKLLAERAADRAEKEQQWEANRAARAAAAEEAIAPLRAQLAEAYGDAFLEDLDSLPELKIVDHLRELLEAPEADRPNLARVWALQGEEMEKRNRHIVTGSPVASLAQLVNDLVPIKPPSEALAAWRARGEQPAKEVAIRTEVAIGTEPITPEEQQSARLLIILTTQLDEAERALDVVDGHALKQLVGVDRQEVRTRLRTILRRLHWLSA